MKRFLRVLACVLLTLGVLMMVAHFFVARRARMTRPVVDTPREVKGHAFEHHGVRAAWLTGSPAQLGADHARLLLPSMMTGERELWGTFERTVPGWLTRQLIIDVGRYRYREVDKNFGLNRLPELEAMTRIVEQQDPFVRLIPSYERTILLHALYDIALSFEHSPLIGCSAFGVNASSAEAGHVWVGRAFDFEATESMDRDKHVLFYAPDGAIPFASVAWAGLAGVVTGMNVEGVFVAVHGGRAGTPVTSGTPVVFSMRGVLETAHTTKEAVERLTAESVMVSHIAVVADARGDFAVVERAPGLPAFVRASPGKMAITNHFEGPFRNDPRNVQVEKNTSTLARRARLDELLLQASSFGLEQAVATLRDHTCASSAGACALGDRRTIDALIATHGVVADTAARQIWVSRGPHLSGEFVGFDLRSVFAGQGAGDLPIVASDRILQDGRYDKAMAGRTHGEKP